LELITEFSIQTSRKNPFICSDENPMYEKNDIINNLDETLSGYFVIFIEAKLMKLQIYLSNFRTKF
jgi:hypothetical protein